MLYVGFKINILNLCVCVNFNSNNIAGLKQNGLIRKMLQKSLALNHITLVHALIYLSNASHALQTL